MKLLITGGFTGEGGAERTLIPLAEKLHQAGHELTLLLLRRPDAPEFFSHFPGTVVIAAEGTSWRSKLRAVARLRKAVAEAELVIATSELTYTFVTWALTRWHGKPLIADIQVHLSRWIDDSCHPIFHRLSRLIYPRINYIRCVSEGLVRDMQTNYQVPNENLHVIYVPFDVEAIERASVLSIAADHNHIFSRPTIIASGRFTTQKRFDIAIESLACLRRDHQIDARLLILGDGALRPQLEQRVRELNLSEHVFMPGFVENPHAYVGRSQVFLLSSDYEGLPRVLIEALASGCPAVATDCPSGPDEILEGGKYGLLTPMREPAAIAQALARVLNDAELSQTFRRTGFERAKKFNLQNVVRQYEALLERAMQN